MADRARSRPVNLSDVARRAGVSVPTASRILNGGVRSSETVNPELRERVTEAADALGYSVSRAAQAIKNGQARTIALIVSDIDDFGSATMIAGVMRAAERRGVSVAVRTTLDDARREVDLLTQLRGERHRAVVLATSRTLDQAREATVGRQLRILTEQGTRVVLIGDSDLEFPRVTVDNRHAAAELASGLVAAGRRRFAVISGPQDQVTSRDRVEGFLEGLAKHGIAVPDELVVHASFSREGGRAGALALLERAPDLDVIAAMSDAMAVGAIALLRQHGVRAPDDVEVTGFDHVPMLGDVLPEFSTVAVPLEEFGEAALALAMDPESEPNAAANVVLTASPIVHGVARVG